MKKSKIKTEEKCKFCDAVESSRDYFHDKYHEEADKVKVLTAAIALMSSELRDMNSRYEILEHNYSLKR